MSTEEIIAALRDLSDPLIAERKAKDFGIPIRSALGLYQKDINAIAKEIGKDSALALKIIQLDIYEAKLLAAKIFRPKDLTISMMDEWVNFFDTWEMCDTYCMQIFKYSEHAWSRIELWSLSDQEYVKRAAYATLATIGQGQKDTPNETYDRFYPLIIRDATDPRNFVKKAVNWSIREIGKRNVDLQRRCIELCHQLMDLDDKTARWIAKDALRELEGDNVRIRNQPRTIYGLIKRRL